MVSVIKRKINGKEYYSLQYSYRENGDMRNLYKEIGKKIPENIEDIKEEFIEEIVNKRWSQFIEETKNRFKSKLDKLPKSRQLEHFKNFGIRFTYHTNKIEGSTLTLREVDLAVNEPNIPINKSTNDIVEAKLHWDIYNEFTENIDDFELSRELTLEWHGKLFSMHPNRNNFAGMIRKDQIYISGSNYVPPSGGIVCEELLDDLFEWYNEKEFTMHPLLLACLMHFRYVSIHPFLDGNGRLSRLVMNYILYKNNYPMFDIPYSIRKSYYNALERANLKEDDMIFVGWFFRNYLKYAEDLKM
ncbi:MAG: Fic family protein [Candidatus Odinarchaeota archaeon]